MEYLEKLGLKKEYYFDIHTSGQECIDQIFTKNNIQNLIDK